MQTNDKLRDAIATELQKENPDWRLIERISRDEIDSDVESVRFSVDAGHIKRIGLELVAKQETALAELIKNSYDADATSVRVEFVNHDRLHGTLTIEDDGDGMRFETVRDSWMRLSTAHKQTSPISPKYGRFRAGRKGIGRFSVQRLGTHLTLETEVAGNETGLRVQFDWDNEFASGKNLHDIFSGVTSYEKPIERHRTKLTITGLREKWSDAAIQKVWKTILLLQPPFEVMTRDAAGAQHFEEDPGFEVVVNGTSSKKEKTTLSIESDFLDHALAEISGEILPSGKAVTHLRSAKLGLKEELEHDKEFLLTGPVTFKARYFIYTPDVLSGLKVGTAQEMGRQYGGIRIYRNGFRVAPYGERADDWLRLDADTSRRVLLVPANNHNFFGHVDLSLLENPLFEETSSREGLIENEAFEELREFVRASIQWAILRVAASRGRKQTAQQKDFVSTARPKKPSEVLEDLTQIVNNSSTDSSNQDPTASSRGLLASAVANARGRILEWEVDVERRQAESIQYEEMLRILATLGLSISVFGHEIKGMRGSVLANVALLERTVDLFPTSSEKEKIQGLVSKLKASTGRMFDLGGYIAGLMTSTESRELRTHSIKGAIERFIQQFGRYMDRQKIEFEFSITRDELRTTEMHASEIDSVLLNFLTNSIKSMKAAKVSPRRVRISVEDEGNHILLSFQDNGGGIPGENHDRVFDAFFTTTSAAADDDGLAGPGTGLGLKIVSDIATSYGGSVSVGTPDDGFNCNMEFRILSGRTGGT